MNHDKKDGWKAKKIKEIKMKIEIHCDASIYPDSHLSGWGGVIITKKEVTQIGGKFDVQPKSSNEAELKAIELSLKKMFKDEPEIKNENIHLYCDSISSLVLLNKHADTVSFSENSHHLKKLNQKTKKELGEIIDAIYLILAETSCRLVLNHVRAHKAKTNMDRIINHLCDKIAKHWAKKDEHPNLSISEIIVKKGERRLYVDDESLKNGEMAFNKFISDWKTKSPK